ncbi:tRNA guanosine-2'-O-methyltransferase [Plasmodium brasilianum]|uniref:tRNA guanosine-2'-O-methyltransferase, putative n=2 Tax=Plasmodium (Plasmodium) TaxID=418103 RepID=A0A1A8W7Z9_PLAMA|nr:tRNA guanosine-2'-O-methyltransferase, putative [Plasmodium malariae]KAI4836363.1 tRNA guanosine-2'-O-methyltransferase [Plasmodium brasilianum]SBS87810.1 tRNA guanosine-2'-O-methyltransferase, putative [Plasmodium malariae]SCO93629.1 tRNA guanosine-2'-O-methyltransferase, putative [Plasmodium malariae]
MSYLIWFSRHKKYDECKIAELKSLLQIYGYNEENEPLFNENKSKFKGEVYIKVDIAEEQLWKNILSRSILIKGVLHIWSEGCSYDELLNDLTNKKHLFEKNLYNNKKWCFYFNSFRRIINQEEKVKKMNYFKSILDNFPNVDLINPDIQLGLIEDYNDCNSGTLKKVYFGKFIATRKYNYSLNYNKGDVNNVSSNTDGNNSSTGGSNGSSNCNSKDDANISVKNFSSTSKDASNSNNTTVRPRMVWWVHYALNRRPVLGPTTTDNELAFIMCNIAKIKKGDIVLDPFVGSGGLLVTSSTFNAICIGNDIDIRLLKGYKLAYLNPHVQHKKKNKSIFENFHHYNLNLPDILVSDNSKPIWNTFHKAWVDAIVSDPPYGVRAPVRICMNTSGRMENKRKVVSSDNSNSVNGCIRSDVDIAAKGTGKDIDDGVNDDTNAYADDDGNNNDESLNNDNIKCTQKNGLTSMYDTGEPKKVKNIMNTKMVSYSCKSAVKDLLNIASSTLVDDGMLVFLLPVQKNTIEEDIALLKHDDFYLMSYDFQTFTNYSGRLIVSMRRKCRNSSN